VKPPGGQASARPPLAALLMILVAICLPPLGGGMAKALAEGRDILGLAFLRNAISALLLLAIARPRIITLNREQWRAVAMLGGSLALMNATFYLAIERLPLGVTVTIEFLGPLGVCLIGARRALDRFWPLIAFLGIVLLAWPDHGQADRPAALSLDRLGLLCALIAGFAWGAYILAARQAGRAIAGLDGLALSLAAAALFLAPFGLLGAMDFTGDAPSLGGALAVACLATLLPYMLEFMALRHVPAPVFGVFLACEPALAALVGALILGERLTPPALFAIALVTIAAFGAALRARSA
jgi:inner membrane transporter RhtA